MRSPHRCSPAGSGACAGTDPTRLRVWTGAGAERWSRSVVPGLGREVVAVAPDGIIQVAHDEGSGEQPRVLHGPFRGKRVGESNAGPNDD